MTTHANQPHTVEEMLENVGIHKPEYASHLPGYVHHPAQVIQERQEDPNLKTMANKSKE